MKGKVTIILASSVIVLCAISGCRKLPKSSPVFESNPGIIKARLHLWEADQGIIGFIKSNNWSYTHEFIDSSTFKLNVTTPENDMIVFHCRQEHTKNPIIVVLITKNEESWQPQLTNDLKASIEGRFD
jgi:hypothetical protein